MAKHSQDDKMRIRTLREQGLGEKAIKSAYPLKKWSLNTLQMICRRIDQTGSAVERKVGSGRPKSVRSTNNIAMVHEMLCFKNNLKDYYINNLLPKLTEDCQSTLPNIDFIFQ